MYLSTGIPKIVHEPTGACTIQEGDECLGGDALSPGLGDSPSCITTDSNNKSKLRNVLIDSKRIATLPLTW